MKIKPWMYGVGVVGVGVVGVVLYEVTKKPAAILPPSTTVHSPGASLPAPVPVARPSIAAPGTFSQTQSPAGPVIIVANGGSTNAPIGATDNVTLVLPSSGGHWANISFGNSKTKAINGLADLTGDTTSPVSLTASQLSGSDAIMAQWVAPNGDHQMMAIMLQKKVVLRP